MCHLLTPANPDARKRLPSQSNADLASNIRHEVVAMLKVHKGDWPCVFASQMNTFFIPQGSCSAFDNIDSFQYLDVDRLTLSTQKKLFEDIVDKDVDKSL